MTKLKVGTLFSGIGAPEMALNLANIDYESVYACDFDSNCKKTYLNNFTVKRFYNDINEMGKVKEEIDLLVFGFPCQSFSIAGKGNGLRDIRGKLALKALDILDEQRPKYFIAENVLGLLEQTDAFKKIKKRMSRNYNVEIKVLDALDYGLPQKRQRVWFVGIRKDLKKSFKFPEVTFPKVKLADFLDKGGVEGKYYATSNFLNKEKVKNKLQSATGEYIPCITHTIARNGSSREYISYVASVFGSIGEKRKPTPEECLKLFGFKNFKFPVDICTTNKYMQVGNTMAVPVLKEIIKELING